MIETMPLKLEDLVPKETTFTLSTLPGKTLTLCRWSLRVRGWATSKFTPGGLEMIFRRQQIQEISEIAFFMLREKDLFPAVDGMTAIENFQDHISTTKDQINVIMALLGAVGIGEPEMKEINDAIASKEKTEDPNEPGATPAP